MTVRYLLLLIAVVCVAAGATWIISKPIVARPPIDGIACQSMEGQVLHFHVQLQLFRSGEPVVVPAGIGIANGCFYWLHTHTADGIIHIESPEVRDFTLGQFFDIWGQKPAPGSVRVFVKHEGENSFREVTDDWRSLVLSSHEIIAMGTGTFVPKPFNFPEGL